VDTKTSAIDTELRARGYRLTPRRLVVAEVLAECGGHLTMEAILAGVQGRYPSTNKTTVYRTLELLHSLGMVVITDLGGGTLEYELVGHPHHHLICEKCGNRIEVADHLLEPLRASLLEHYGFSTNLDHFALFGICPDCAKGSKFKVQGSKLSDLEL
jgi:Fur family transcriptional regulator, ferric uptake regulator